MGDDERKIDGVLRYSQGGTAAGWSLTGDGLSQYLEFDRPGPGPGHRGRGRSGGRARAARRRHDFALGRDRSIRRRQHRALRARCGTGTGRRQSRIHADALYGIYYDLDLFSDFTYFLVDPVHGDQIEQQDNAVVFGGAAHRHWAHTLFGGGLRDHARPAGPQRRYPATACSIPNSGSGLRPIISTRHQRNQRRAVSGEPDPLDALAAHHPGVAGRSVRIRCAQYRGRQFRRCHGRVLEPESQDRVRALGRRPSSISMAATAFTATMRAAWWRRRIPRRRCPDEGRGSGRAHVAHHPDLQASLAFWRSISNRNWSGMAMRATISPAGPTDRLRDRVLQLLHAHAHGSLSTPIMPGRMRASRISSRGPLRARSTGSDFRWRLGACTIWTTGPKAGRAVCGCAISGRAT